MGPSDEGRGSVGPVGLAAKIEAALRGRFGKSVIVPDAVKDNRGLQAIERMATRRVHREYSNRAVDPMLVQLLCACALSSPSKSDLQQRDIFVVDAPALRDRIADLVPDSPHVRQAPDFLVFYANAGRLPAICGLRDKPFPNDHLDLFFNAVGDAAIALATCVCAAEALGLGTCPISEIRNQPKAFDRLLGIPHGIIGFAGLCVGWPAEPGTLSPRLSLAATVHRNGFDQSQLETQLAEYDFRRESLMPYESQLDSTRWGTAEHYGWAEHKARQYAAPQRTGFGAYVREKGIKLD